MTVKRSILRFTIFKLLFVSSLTLVSLASCNKDDEDDSDDSTNIVVGDFTESVSEAMMQNQSSHEASTDYIWDSNTETIIELTGATATITGSGATVSGSIITINSAGNYSISGSLTDGQIYVTATSSSIVRLIFNGLNISCTYNAPIYVTEASKTIIYLAPGTTNTLSDATTYINEDDANAALYCKTNLTIFGTGSLAVDGNFNDGICGKDGLIIKSGNFNVTAADDGIRGKDYLIFDGGSFGITSGGDGLKSDNEDYITKGYVLINDGDFDITAGGDGITGYTDILITGGDFNLKTGGGSNTSLVSDASAKGIKAGTKVIIEGGTSVINCADDAIHSNYSIVFNAGTLEITSGDDGIHADSILGIYGGKITITKASEGVESADIVINSGEINITTTDDGFNAAGGVDGSGSGGWGGSSPTSGNNYLAIQGGEIFVNSAGDGLDANGSIVMSGGSVFVNGPTDNGNGAIDYDGTFIISGGVLVAAGSSGMVQSPSSTSSQYSAQITYGSSQTANKIFRLQSNGGTEIITFAPSKTYQSIVISSPSIADGNTYEIYAGGNSSGTNTNGYYSGGTYSGGSKVGSFKVSSIISKISL